MNRFNFSNRRHGKVLAISTGTTEGRIPTDGGKVLSRGNQTTEGRIPTDGGFTITPLGGGSPRPVAGQLYPRGVR